LKKYDSGSGVIVFYHPTIKEISGYYKNVERLQEDHRHTDHFSLESQIEIAVRYLVKLAGWDLSDGPETVISALLSRCLDLEKQIAAKEIDIMDLVNLILSQQQEGKTNG